MNFGKLREVFVQNIPNKKKLLHVFHRCHCVREMSRIPLPQENQRHLWSDPGKIKFSPSLVGQMTLLMGKMITRHKYLSNELSWAQFGVEEGIQELTATALFLEAASFGTFWPVLGDLTFDRETELQIEKFQFFWKLDSNTFPTSYPAPASDTGKASRSLLKKGATRQRRATRWEFLHPISPVRFQTTSNCFKFSSRPLLMKIHCFPQCEKHVNVV